MTKLSAVDAYGSIAKVHAIADFFHELHHRCRKEPQPGDDLRKLARSLGIGVPRALSGFRLTYKRHRHYGTGRPLRGKKRLVMLYPARSHKTGAAIERVVQFCGTACRTLIDGKQSCFDWCVTCSAPWHEWPGVHCSFMIF